MQAGRIYRERKGREREKEKGEGKSPGRGEKKARRREKLGNQRCAKRSVKRIEEVKALRGMQDSATAPIGTDLTPTCVLLF